MPTELQKVGAFISGLVLLLAIYGYLVNYVVNGPPFFCNDVVKGGGSVACMFAFVASFAGGAILVALVVKCVVVFRLFAR